MSMGYSDGVSALNSAGEWFCSYSAALFVQFGVLTLLIFVVDLCIRRRARAVTRYALWLLPLVKLLLPPALSLPTSLAYWVRPAAPSPVVADSGASVSRPAAPAAGLPAPEYALGQPVAVDPAPEDSGWVTEPSDSRRAVQPDRTKTAPPVSSASPVQPPRVSLTWRGGAFGGWLLGVVSLTVLLVVRIVRVGRIVRRSRPAPFELQPVLSACESALGGRSRRVRLRISDDLASPAVCGWLRPAILLPAHLVVGGINGHLRNVLLHELLHIRRHDLRVDLLQNGLQILHFHNPAVWFVNRMVRRLREQAVDEAAVVALGGATHEYSTTLLDLAVEAQLQPDVGLRVLGRGESRSVLRARIAHLVGRPVPRHAKLGVFGFAALIGFSCVMLPMAGAPQPLQPDPSPSAAASVDSTKRDAESSSQPTPAVDNDANSQPRETDGLAVTAYNTDGTPLANARVILGIGRERSVLTVLNGNILTNNDEVFGSDVAFTDSMGRFILPTPGPGIRVTAIIDHPDGIAIADHESLAATRRLTLSPWGRVEGAAFRAGNPSAGESVELEVFVLRSEFRCERIARGRAFVSGSSDFLSRVVLHYAQTTTSGGWFTFPRVCPGNGILRLEQAGTGPRSELLQYIAVEPGRTTMAGLPRPGFQLKGVLPRPEGDEVPWDNSRFKHELSLDALGSPKLRYLLSFAPDEPFVIEGVWPGTYVMSVWADEQLHGVHGMETSLAITPEIVVDEQQAHDGTIDIGRMPLLSYTEAMRVIKHPSGSTRLTFEPESAASQPSGDKPPAATIPAAEVSSHPTPVPVPQTPPAPRAAAPLPQREPEHLTVAVRNTDGSPLANAAVQLLFRTRGPSVNVQENELRPSVSGSNEVQVVVTDELGLFTVTKPDTVDEGLTVTASVNHPDGVAQVDYEALAVTREITLSPWGRVEGTLYYAGRPAPGTRVALSVFLPVNCRYTQETDADGRFVFPHVCPGSGLLSIGEAAASGGSGLFERVVVEPGCTIIAGPPGPGVQLKGVVPRPEGDQVPWERTRSEQLMLVAVGTPKLRYRLPVKPDEPFVIEEFWPGTYVVEVRADERLHGILGTDAPFVITSEFVVDEQQARDGTVDIGRVPLLSYTAAIERMRAHGHSDASTQPAREPAAAESQPTSRDGPATAARGAEAASQPTSAPAPQAPRALPPSPQKEPEPLTVTACNTDGSPLAHAAVQLLLQRRGYGPSVQENGIQRSSSDPNEVRVVVTDEMGRFAVTEPGLAGERSTVTALINHPDGVAQADYKALAATRRMTLSPWGRVEGTLYRAGRPAPDTRVTLSVFLPVSYSYMQQTDADGRFVFPRVCPGRGSLHFGQAGASSQSSLIIEPGRTTDAGLPRPGFQLRGVLPLAEGDQVPWQRTSSKRLLLVALGASNLRYWLPFAPAEPFVIEGVSPGTYVMSVWADEQLHGVRGMETSIAITPEIVVDEQQAHDGTIDIGRVPLLSYTAAIEQLRAHGHPSASTQPVREPAAAELQPASSNNPAPAVPSAVPASQPATAPAPQGRQAGAAPDSR